jgi:hypothetical protein
VAAHSLANEFCQRADGFCVPASLRVGPVPLKTRFLFRGRERSGRSASEQLRAGASRIQPDVQATHERKGKDALPAVVNCIKRGGRANNNSAAKNGSASNDLSANQAQQQLL